VSCGATHGETRGDGIARSDQPSFDEVAQARGKRQGARRRRVSEQQTRQACLDREIRVDPMEGALVRSVSVALNQRRALRAWRGVALRTASS